MSTPARIQQHDAQLRPLVDDLIAVLQVAGDETDTEAVERAVAFAAERHADQVRKSGEPYVVHPLGVARICLWQWVGLKNYGPHYPLIAFTIGGSLIGVVLWGSLIGAMLPILLRFVRLDPATCSAPFVATLVDVTGIVIYFTVASHLLRGTLL